MFRPTTQLLVWFLLLSAAAPAESSATRLDTTADQPVSVAADYEFAANGQWLVIRGAARNDGPAELYCLSASGGVPTRLSADLPTDRSIASWQLSPSGSHVTYFADQDVPQRGEVFVAPLPSGAFYKVSDTLVEAGSSYGAFAGTAGDRVAYVGAKVTGPFSGPFYELFSVPVGGGESIRLNGPLTTGGDVQDIVVRADGGRLLYLADQDVDEKFELFSVVPDGGIAVKLNPAMNDMSDVLRNGLAFSPDGSRVAFQVDRRPDQRVELFSVPTNGGTAVPLNSGLPAGGNVTRGSQQFSPDGTRVIYHADQNADEVYEVFSVPASGGASLRLNGPLTTHGDVRAAGLRISPNSARVLYTADQVFDGVHELFSVPIAGGAADKLSGDMILDGDVEDDVEFNFDSSRVLFRADRRVDEVVELFSTPSAGGLPTLLNVPLVSHGDVVRAAFTPDGREVVYLADQEVDEVYELFAVSATGGAVRKLSEPLVTGGDVLDWKFSPDGSQLIYRADQEVDQLYQLYSVELNLGSAPLSGDFNSDGVVDTADYTKWRDGLGSLYTESDYTMWKTNFGRQSGAGALATVPEPHSLTVLAAFVVSGLLLHRRQSSQSFSASRAGTYSSVT